MAGYPHCKSWWLCILSKIRFVQNYMLRCSLHVKTVKTHVNSSLGFNALEEGGSPCETCIESNLTSNWWSKACDSDLFENSISYRVKRPTKVSLKTNLCNLKHKSSNITLQVDFPSLSEMQRMFLLMMVGNSRAQMRLAMVTDLPQLRADACCTVR